MSKKKGHRTNYAPETIENAIKVVALLNGNIEKAARTLGIPRPTLRSWIFRNPDRAEKLLKSQKLLFSRQTWSIIKVCLTQLKKKIKTAGAKEIAQILAILYDKHAYLDSGTGPALVPEKPGVGVSDKTRDIFKKYSKKKGSLTDRKLQKLLGALPPSQIANG